VLEREVLEELEPRELGVLEPVLEPVLEVLDDTDEPAELLEETLELRGEELAELRGEEPPELRGEEAPELRGEEPLELPGPPDELLPEELPPELALLEVLDALELAELPPEEFLELPFELFGLLLPPLLLLPPVQDLQPFESVIQI
jgi:hypothetical protein